MSNTFFVSDNHLGHKSILKFCPNTRLGLDVVKHIDEIFVESNPDYKHRHQIVQNYVREMDAKMIQVWNETVLPNDLVYILGDFSFYRSGKTEEILQQLNGSKILIRGNHDHWLDENTKDYFLFVRDYLSITIGKQPVILFHYPIAEWERIHHGAYHLYGHVHGSLQLPGRALDVGLDNRPNGDMKPWSWEEISALLSTKEILKPHGKTKLDEGK